MTTVQDKNITVEQLQRMLNNNERVFILDVRPLDQRKEWKIAGSTHVDAYKQLIAGDDTALDVVEVPADSTVVTVCAAGRTSLLAANLLEKKGVRALSLEGGMKAWNFAWSTAEMQLHNDVKVIQVRRAAKGVLSYVVGSGNEAIVIDAALKPEVYIKIARDNGWTIRYVMDTHIHADYVSRTRELASVANAKHFSIDKAQVEFETHTASNGQSLSFGNSHVEFMHTPGHTWESTTFKIENAIFTGDTLFIDGIGRPDLKADRDETAKRAGALYRSLTQLFSSDPTMYVFPAHTSEAIAFDNKIVGDQLGNIRKRVTVTELSEADFIEYTLSRIPPTPPNYLTIAALNRKGSHEGEILADLEAGGNHCAI